MQHVGSRRRTAVLGAVLALAVSCTRQASSPSSHAAPPATQASPAVAVFDPRAACGQAVPGAQHATRATVGEVRRQGIGLVGPRPAVRHFASADATTAPAAYCYRWLPSRHLDEWWGVSASGSAVLIGGFGGLSRDMGTFNGAAFD